MDDIRPDSSQTLQLLDEAARANQKAIGQLLQRHLPSVEAAVACRINRRVRSRLDDCDIVQETQLEAMRRLDEYLTTRPMPFYLWIKREAHQQILKAERRHMQTAKRAINREVPLPDQTSLHLIAGIVAAGHSPVSQAARRELARRVRRALARLAEGDREIVMLRNFDGLSNGEAACLLEITGEAAKKRYTRALLRLREFLLDEGLTGDQS